MKLTFANADLVRLVADATEKWPNGCMPLWDEETGAGFWIVGDQGVYLMHNGNRPEGDKAVVAYARECNPDTLSFDEWWQSKRASFGGDDGADFIEPEAIINAASEGCDVEMLFSDDSMTITVVRP
ncbi:DUF3085 domain-containing protein [Sinorhizobium fredii]|uniref:DUF3085 domain-containing protein n=1 Tax=Rhizobium fredii TaxID=380 RepID=UPI0030A78087